MAILEIKKAGAPVLKEVCAPVEKIDKDLRKLLDDMAVTMYESDGVGLAAPQVGRPIRVVVIDCQDDHGSSSSSTPSSRSAKARRRTRRAVFLCRASTVRWSVRPRSRWNSSTDAARSSI